MPNLICTVGQDHLSQRAQGRQHVVARDLHPARQLVPENRKLERLASVGQIVGQRGETGKGGRLFRSLLGERLPLVAIAAVVVDVGDRVGGFVVAAAAMPSSSSMSTLACALVASARSSIELSSSNSSCGNLASSSKLPAVPGLAVLGPHRGDRPAILHRTLEPHFGIVPVERRLEMAPVQALVAGIGFGEALEGGRSRPTCCGLTFVNRRAQASSEYSLAGASRDQGLPPLENDASLLRVRIADEALPTTDEFLRGLVQSAGVVTRRFRLLRRAGHAGHPLLGGGAICGPPGKRFDNQGERF